ETTSASSPRSLSPRLGDGRPDGGADHRRWRELVEFCADRFLSYQFRDLTKSIQRVSVPAILSGAKRPRRTPPLLDVQPLLGPVAREDRQLVLGGEVRRDRPLWDVLFCQHRGQPLPRCADPRTNVRQARRLFHEATSWSCERAERARPGKTLGRAVRED